MKKILILSLAAIIGLSCTACAKIVTNSQKPTVNTEFEEETQNQSSHVSYQAYDTSTSSVVITGTNISDMTLGEVKAELNFFKDGTLINTVQESLYGILPNQKIAFGLQKPIYTSFELVPYDYFEINITTDENIISDNFVNNISTKEHKEEDSIVIECTNNGDELISFEKYRVVFYDDNKAVGVSLAVGMKELNKGDSLTLKAKIPTDNNNNETITFDKYEVLPCEMNNP